jgi:biopolymer transport protein ExbD
MRKSRRRQVEVPDLEITALMNVMMILVPFLLVTAVFSHTTIIDLFLPSGVASRQLTDVPFHLEIVVREKSIEVRETKTETARVFARSSKGFDMSAISSLLGSLKSQYPDQADVSLLAEGAVAYDVLINIMDSVRSRTAIVGGKPIKQVLFPNVSIGDAPSSRESP